eukprot:913646-Pyramimonas_sp.AAC.1
MVQRKQFTIYKERAEQECDMGNPAISVEDVLLINYDLFTTINQFADAIPKNHLDAILQEALRFVYPGVADDDDSDPMWLLKSKSAAEVAIKVLKCPMSGTALYLSSAKKNKAGEASMTDGGKATTTGKGRGKGKGKKSKGRGSKKPAKGAAAKTTTGRKTKKDAKGAAASKAISKMKEETLTSTVELIS